MNRIRNGRVILENQVRDILLPDSGEFTFYFSRYYAVGQVWNYSKNVKKIVCTDSKSHLHGDASHDEAERMFWGELQGYETGSDDNENTNYYVPVAKGFGILRDAELLYTHDAYQDILKQLRISSLTPFLNPESFDLRTTGEIVQMETQQMRWTAGRSAAFEQAVNIGGQKYLLEAKGVSVGHLPLNLNQQFSPNSCGGGMALGVSQRSVEMKRHLNAHGYDSDLIVAAYQIPKLKQFNGQYLGAVIRAVNASPSISHYHECLPAVATSLDMSSEELGNYIITGAVRDMAKLWRAGVVHKGPVHEQNIRIGCVTDFAGSQYVRNSGFSGIAKDAETFVRSCEHVISMLETRALNMPPPELYETDPDRAIAMEVEAYQRSEIEAASRKHKARRIITRELNQALGLRLPPVVGTTTLAGQIYDMQRTLGLTDKHEKLHVEYSTGISNQKTRTLSLSKLTLKR